jgi:hypothetical protein
MSNELSRDYLEVLLDCYWHTVCIGWFQERDELQEDIIRRLTVTVDNEEDKEKIRRLMKVLHPDLRMGERGELLREMLEILKKYKDKK